jgi:hypothetical protein
LSSEDRRLQPAHAFFGALLARDASGRSWLPALLAATPGGRRWLGRLVDDPGSLLMSLSTRTASGGLGCFEYPAAPPRELLEWFIDRPDRLVWPERAQLTAETVRLRRALLQDDPPGSRARAQDRARQLLATWSPLSPDWWRFEDMTTLDCVLMTDRLLVTVATEPLEPATEWYPPRSRLVRGLEAARQLAHGRRWASLAISERRVAQAAPENVRQSLEQGAPHLDAQARADLGDAYLGNLTWVQARRAVGLPLTSPGSR